MSDKHTGACFCGAVVFEVTGQPAAMGYCHCDDCRGWLGAPVNAFGLWPADAVRFVKGEDNVGTYAKTDQSLRKFCKTCGGAVLTEHPGMGLTDAYPALIAGFRHEPAMHVHYAQKMMSVVDGLPKFKDLPKEVGGSGELLPE